MRETKSTEVHSLRVFTGCLLGLALACSAGCVSVISSMAGSMAADTLTSAVLNQDNPALVRDGLPAYMLLLDGFIAESPDDPGLLAAGAQLFALYGSRFADDVESSVDLTAKGRRYGERSICLAHEPACDWAGMGYDEFVSQLREIDGSQLDYLYSYAISWLSYLDATSSDWTAVAELPWVHAAMDRALELDETYENGALHGYLGILNALRPPALGGQPDVARSHFERAIELSEGKDLSIKVEFARRYARMMFDQDLHDRLLQEVLDAPTESLGFTLFNSLAQDEAALLLDSSAEYF